MTAFPRVFARLLLVALPAAAAIFANEGSAEPLQVVGELAEPRILVLALDGVPYRSILGARDAGAFAGWPQPAPLVSTFPSLTNVGFTAMFEPFGVEAAGGYEVRYFDFGRNSLVGRSPFGYRERAFAWRDRFDVTGRTVASKLASYTGPLREAWKQVDDAERALLESESELVLAHVGATDALIHLRGDRAILRFLLELDPRLAEMRQRHLARQGSALRVILLSDHGNSDIKVHRAGGVRHRLRRAGLNVARRLRETDDVVAPTFGLVGYGALYLRPDHADAAARAVAEDAEVDLAAWRSGERQVSVVSRHGEARFDWRGAADGKREYRYEAVAGDPLRLSSVCVQLRGWGLMDEHGYAGEEEWFRLSATGPYPDPLRRLADALTGSYVSNQGSVVFSLRPGYAWGWSSAHVSSRLTGGRLEGTHGGLDRDSSLGFFMASDAALQPRGALSANRAFVGIGEMLEAREESVAVRASAAVCH